MSFLPVQRWLYVTEEDTFFVRSCLKSADDGRAPAHADIEPYFCYIKFPMAAKAKLTHLVTHYARTLLCLNNYLAFESKWLPRR